MPLQCISFTGFVEIPKISHDLIDLKKFIFVEQWYSASSLVGCVGVVAVHQLEPLFQVQIMFSELKLPRSTAKLKYHLLVLTQIL